MKPRPVAKAKTQSKVDHQLEVFKTQTEARYQLAMQLYEAQDAKTKEALSLIVQRLRSIATGQIRIYPNGRSGKSVVVPIEPVYQDQNLLYLATEIVKDLAYFGVKVANYEFPSVYCAECGEKLTPPRKRRAATSKG